MNYKAILLVTGGVMIGALTFGAIGVSAQNPDGSFSKGYEQRHGPAMAKNHGFVAEVLGIDFDELRALRQDGKTMEEIAVAQGHDSFESFKTAVEDKVRIKLAEEGLSEDEINERIEHHKQRIEERMEHSGDGFGERRSPHRTDNRDGSRMHQYRMENSDN